MYLFVCVCLFVIFVMCVLVFGRLIFTASACVVLVGASFSVFFLFFVIVRCMSVVVIIFMLCFE